MRGIRLGVMIGLGVIAGALGVVPPAVADSAPRVQPLVQSPAAIRAYWTGARMRDAKPADAIPGSPLQPTGGAAVTSAAKRSSLHERVTKTNSYPNRTDGKVFFTLPGGPPDGGDYVCSGTAVRSPGRSLVWTAGHCVFDPGEMGVLGAGYATHWEFVPAYNGGKKPFGEWPATSLATTQQWHGTGPLNGGNSAFDFGAATVAPRGGKLLQDRIGARRLAFSYTRNQTYTAFGYPAEQPPPEFDGQHLFKCRSPYRGSDDRVGPPPAIRISCDMTGGSSGGGWIIRRDGTGYVASVTSYGYSNDPNGLYGPYQGNVARSLARSAGG